MHARRNSLVDGLERGFREYAGISKSANDDLQGVHRRYSQVVGHFLTSSVVGGTPTVAEAGGVTSAPGGGQAA